MERANKEITNVRDLRLELVEVFKALRDKTMKPQDAKEINNSAGKILNTCKQQIEYNRTMDYKRKIEFLEVESE